jgi:hypothetical protein
MAVNAVLMVFPRLRVAHDGIWGQTLQVHRTTPLVSRF